MSWRPWIVAAAFIAVMMINLVLVVQERLPEAQGGPQVARIDEVLRHMQYTPATRRNNFKNMGMSPELAESAAKYIDRYTRKQPLFVQMLSEQAAMVGGAFCPGTGLPQPYAAAQFLVTDVNDRRDVVDPERLREFEEQPWFIASPVQAIYTHFELTEGRFGDATLLGVSALLVSKEDDALYGYAPFSTGIMGARGWKPLKKQHPRVELTAIQYFSLMHYLTELANTRDGICS